MELATPMDTRVAIAQSVTNPNRIRFTIVSPRTTGSSVDAMFIKNLLKIYYRTNFSFLDIKLALVNSLTSFKYL